MKDKVKKIFFTLILFSNQVFSQSSSAYLDQGDGYIAENKFSQAENVFRKGLKEDPNNLILKSQLALALLSQDKNDDAEIVIGEILSEKPDFTAALWYGGINNFSKKEPDFRKAIYYFEKAYDLIDKKSDQYFGINYYIARSYRKLLYREGLTYTEVDRMLETYKKYVDLQPNAEDANDAKNFIKKVKEKRPGKNVGRWIITSQQNVEDLIRKPTQ
ncbi:tetratricopeptide repeat protein [Chryseobacterium gregarium]|uniref:tetratricopeptide repeat protein n=1 Tax=Chryseobacterium gregarium TaxID=456299 RepID=UPI00042A442A|nr:tetratricopeptide repeat protein [Chryseobacterium gregarium]